MDSFGHGAETLGAWLSRWVGDVGEGRGGVGHLVADFSVPVLTAAAAAFGGQRLIAYEEDVFRLVLPTTSCLPNSMVRWVMAFEVRKEMSAAEIQSHTWLHVAAASTLGFAQAALRGSFDLSFRNILCFSSPLLVTSGSGREGIPGAFISAGSLERLEELLFHSLLVLKADTLTPACETSIAALQVALALFNRDPVG